MYMLFLKVSIHLVCCRRGEFLRQRVWSEVLQAAGGWRSCVTEDGSILAQSVQMTLDYIHCTQALTALILFNASADQILSNSTRLI